MPINKLLKAALDNDIPKVEAILADLEDKHIRDAFNLGIKLSGQPAAEYRILRWVTSRARPENKYDEMAWLRAMNNGTLRAITEGTDEERLEMVTRSMEVAPDNIGIYHNAACVYCALGLADEAMDTVVSAVEHGYENMMLLAEDPDLELISQHPGFLALVADAQSGELTKLNETIAKVSEEVLRGSEVPADLVRIWRGSLAQTDHTPGPPFLDQLFDSEPVNVDALDDLRSDPRLGHAWSQLLATTDLVASLSRRGGFIGYYRGESGERSPSDGPVLLFDRQGEFEVAASVAEVLVLESERRRDGIDDLRLFFANTNLLRTVELDAAKIRTRMAASHTDLLDRVAALVSTDVASSAEDEESLRRFEELVRPGEPTREVYLPSVLPYPWRSGEVTRLGGSPLGVSVETRPRHKGSFMAHLMTIDLNAVPALRDRTCFREKEDARAFAVFVAVCMCTFPAVPSFHQWGISLSSLSLKSFTPKEYALWFVVKASHVGAFAAGTRAPDIENCKSSQTIF
jgi:hypothetical protein